MKRWRGFASLMLALACEPDAAPSGAPAAASVASRSRPSDSAQTPFEALRSNPEGDLIATIAALVDHCDDPRTMPALTARAGSLSASHAAEPFELFAPIAQVLAYCDARAERLLVGWLAADTGKRRAAARAIAAIAARRRRLEPSTIVALLRHPDLEETWFGVSQLSRVPASVQSHALEQAAERLERGMPRAYWILRALANAGQEAAPLLLEVVLDEQSEVALRLAAVSSLGRLGRKGQETLAQTLGVEAPSVLLAVVRSFDTDTIERQRRALARLASGGPHATLRCAAASQLGTPGLLEACDPARGAAFKLAWLDAFARSGSKGEASSIFAQLLRDSDVVVARRALTLLRRFPERPEFDEAVRAALSAANPGVVAEAARVLSDVARSHPARAPSQETVHALKRALLAPGDDHAVATRVALIEAAGALQVLSLKRVLPSLCESPQPSVRRAVQRTLLELHADACPPRAVEAPSELTPRTERDGPARIQFALDERTLWVELSPTLPPALRDRLLAHVDGGHFDGTRVAVSPRGEWARVGDPEGDDVANGRTAPWSSRPAGQAVGRFDVVLWQYDIHSAGMELLINFEDRPDLDASHTLVGIADEAWATVEHLSVLSSAHARR